MRPEGLEPPTYCSEDNRSIQLSYGRPTLLIKESQNYTISYILITSGLFRGERLSISLMSTPYSRLVDKALNIFRMEQKMSLISEKPFQGEEAFVRPFITIAREPGSGGRPIAHAVAEKLGFACLDEQIIDEISKSTKKRKAIVQTIDEKTRSKIEDIVHSVLNEEYLDDVKYLTEMTKVILSYALKGKVVIVGRGANFITPFAKGLHVNITAPYEVRVQRAMQFEGVNRERAEAVIAQTEKERKDFVKQYLRQNSDKKNSYDLTLNTQFFRVDEASNLIVNAFNQKFSYTNRRKKS